MKIIYEAEGTIAIVAPNPNSKLSIEEIAKMTVPAGDPFLIVEDDALPGDFEFAAAWEADFSNPDGYGEQVQKPNIITGGN